MKTPLVKKIQFTKRVRRGLALVRQIAVGSFDDNVLSSQHVYSRWTAPQRIEYQLAIDWMAQQAPTAAAKGGE